MSRDPATEPPIDTSLTYYMEERALAIALDKAVTPEQRDRVTHLMALREDMMQRREAHMVEATAKRHARGEVYSASRVAAINAMGPSKEAMDRDVHALYAAQSDGDGVLMTHARVNFGQGLMASRLLLRSMPPDIVDAAREMQRREEAFAGAWIAAIGSDGFAAEVRQAQLDGLKFLRTSTQAVHFVVHPGGADFDDEHAAALGKTWSKLDELAVSLEVEPLSSFLALPDEGESAGVPAARVVASVEALLASLAAPGAKLPAKRATVAALIRVRDLAAAADAGGSVWFEVDI